jgi:hypothetical protein
MKKRPLLLRLLLVFGLLFALAVGWMALEVVAYFGNIVLPWHRQGAIRAACEWGGLAPLPPAANDLEVRTSGSLFTRTFDIGFTAPAEEIEAWVDRSPRLRNTLYEKVNSRDHYTIPGEKGAIGGWVEIDRAAHRVTLSVSWS